MTPEERAQTVIQSTVWVDQEYDQDERGWPINHSAVINYELLHAMISDAIAAAVNDTIEEIATKLERNLHTSAAAIVRQMKEPHNDS